MENRAREHPDSSLEVSEQDVDNRPPFILTGAEIKLLSITGVSMAPWFLISLLTILSQVGFFLDGLSTNLFLTYSTSAHQTEV